MWSSLQEYKADSLEIDQSKFSTCKRAPPSTGVSEFGAESLRAGEPVFPANFGRVLIGQESLEPKAQSLKGFVERYRSEYLPNAIEDGVRESDVMEWWALPRSE